MDVFGERAMNLGLNPLICVTNLISISLHGQTRYGQNGCNFKVMAIYGNFCDRNHRNETVLLLGQCNRNPLHKS